MIRKIVILISLAAFYGCSEHIRAYAEYDHEFHLSDYSTFDWAKKILVEPGKDSLYNTGSNDAKIKLAVKKELEMRGYSQTTNQPDFKVFYHIIVNDQTVLTPEPYGYSYSSFWTKLGTNTYPYGAGTLIVDILDTKTNNLTWRGWVDAPLDVMGTPDEIDEHIKTSVGKIFRKFPNTPKHTFVRDDKL